MFTPPYDRAMTDRAIFKLSEPELLAAQWANFPRSHLRITSQRQHTTDHPHYLHCIGLGHSTSMTTKIMQGESQSFRPVDQNN